MRMQALGMKKQILGAYGYNKRWVERVEKMEDAQIMATYFTIRKSNKLWWQKRRK